MPFLRKFCLPGVALLFFIFGFILPSFAHKAQFGVIWDVPADPIQVRKELVTFQKFGFTQLLLHQLPSTEILDIIELFDLDVSIQLPIQYITTSQIEKEISFIEDQLFDYSYYLKNYSRIKQLGIFKNAQVFNNSFSQLTNSLITTISPFPYSLFYQHSYTEKNELDSSLNWFAIIAPTRFLKSTPIKSDSFFAVVAQVTDTSQWDNRLLQDYVRTAMGKPVFLPSSFVLSEQFELKYANHIIDFIRYDGHIIPQEKLETEDEHPNFLVLIFWLCVVVFGLHFSIDPNFRKSISRYFFAHGFFAGDIMENRVRFSLSVLIAAVTQAVLSGMLSILLFNYVLNEESVQVVIWYYPYIELWSFSLLGWFLLGFTHHLMLTMIQILWLYVAIGEFKSVFQPGTLIVWPQTINFFLAVIIVNAFFNNLNDIFTGFLYLIYVSIVFSTFFWACKDIFSAGRQITVKDHLKTTIPYALLTLGFLLGYLLIDGFFDVVQLSYHFSE